MGFPLGCALGKSLGKPIPALTWMCSILQSLASSSKPSVRYLARLVKNDNRTLMGKTLSRISRETNVTKASLTSLVVTKSMVYFPVPDDQMWRIVIPKDLLNVKQQSLFLGQFNLDETSTMIH